MFEKLQSIIRDFPDNGGGNGYIKDMWRSTLALHASGQKASSGLSDALPYLPVPPEILTLPQHGRILDVGTLGGYGLFDLCFRMGERSKGLHLTGVDINEASVSLASAASEIWREGRNVSFCVCDAHNLPYPTGAFDLVISRLVLPYVMYKAMIAENARVTGAKGQILYQWQSMSYYLHGFRCARGMRKIYYTKVILVGLVLYMTGMQFSDKRLMDVPLTKKQVVKACARCGLVPVWWGGSKRKPMALFARK